MPQRVKPSRNETKQAIDRSLRLWGVIPEQRGEHADFSQKILAQAFRKIESDDYPIDLDELQKLPKDFRDAIQIVYATELKTYHDPKLFKRRQQDVEDALELVEKNAFLLVQPPFFLTQNNVRKKKDTFKKYKVSVLDPFERFSIKIEDVSKAQLAYNQGIRDHVLQGLGFEGIVASHAIHNEQCANPKCHLRHSLFWCGGSETSWRDIYCKACGSCYEIKSKNNLEIIETTSKRSSIIGGSFNFWCEESFENRKDGIDYLVFVSRERTLSNNIWAWRVEIAEIVSMLPALKSSSFAFRDLHTSPLATVASLKNQRKWFDVPTGEQNLNFMEIFRSAFDEVFPNEWHIVTNDSPIFETTAVEQNTNGKVSQPPVSVEALRQELNEMSTDLWDESDSD